MAAKPVRGAPSAKSNDRLWHCTNDEARGTVFVKGAARRSASTWPVPASAPAVERPWSCTLPPELGLNVCGYLDAPSLARLEISRGLGDQAPRAWEAQAAGLDRGDLGDDVSAKRLVGMNVRTLNAIETGTLVRCRTRPSAPSSTRASMSRFDALLRGASRDHEH